MKKAGSFFGFCLVLMAFSYGVASPKPTPEQLAALGGALPPLDTVQNILRYDSLGLNRGGGGPIGGIPFQPDSNYWIAVEFVADTSSFTLQVVFYQFDNSWINTDSSCSLYVVENDTVNNRPAWPSGILTDTSIAAPLPSNKLQSIALKDSIGFGKGKKFWVLLGPVPGGRVNDSNVIGNGWWGVRDTTAARGKSFVSLGNGRTSWDSLPTGNWVLRAGGAFSPAPKVVINEVMFDPDAFSAESSRNHEWVELFNPPGGKLQNTGGWRLTAGQLNLFVNLLPPVDFPEDKYLVIHLLPDSGSDFVDTSFGDGRGDMYLHTGKSGEFFNNRRDACALIVDTVGQLDVRDRFAWNSGNLCLGCNTNPTQVEQLPGMDPADKVIGIRPTRAVGPLLFASAGTSIGRDKSGFKNLVPTSDTGSNVTFLGGKDAAGPTMGRKNSLRMVFDASDHPPVSATWTLILYIAAENGENTVKSAERWYFDLLNQIEREIPSGSGKVNVFVLFDSRSSTVSSSESAFDFGEEAGVEKFGFTVFDTSDQVRIKPRGVSFNTGGTAFGGLLEFVRNHPQSSHLILALKGDGAGWEGLCGDNRGSSTSDWLKMGELKSVLREGLSTKLDLLILDAPMMGQLEVATQVKDFAHFMVASPEMIGPADFDYGRLVKKLKDEPGISADSLARFAVNSILAGRVGQNSFAVWTAVKLDSLDTLLTRVNRLAGDLKIGVEQDICARNIPGDNFQLYLRRMLDSTDHFGKQAQGMADFIDLKDFARHLKRTSPVCGQGRLVHASGIDSLLTLGNPVTVVVARSPLDSVRHPNAGGLSIYFPSSRQHNPPIPAAQKIDTFYSKSDHPFDYTGLQLESGVSDFPSSDTLQQQQVYAADFSACYPHMSTGCDPDSGNVEARNHPFPPVPGFNFVDSTSWDEFLIRYYKPAADAGRDSTDVQLSTPVSRDASGSSDPDTDPALLQYFWDFNSLADTLMGCSDSLDDLDRNCIDDSTDEAELKGKSVTNNSGFGLPGDNTVWLYVWDDRDSFLPIGQRQIQASKDSAIFAVAYSKVFLVHEQEAARGPFANILSTKLSIGVDPYNLNSKSTRTDNVPADKFTQVTDRPHIIWTNGTIGLVSSDSVFPHKCQVALNKALADDKRGAWICSPRIANDTVSTRYVESLFGFRINGAPTSVDYLIPDTASLHFLSGIGTLHLLPGTPLQSLDRGSIKCPTFPILMTPTGQVVAAARVLVKGSRGIVYSTFGLEQFPGTPTAVSEESVLVSRVLRWLSSPQPNDTCGQCPAIKGDMNGDGVINGADVVLLLNCVFIGTGSCDICFADVNCDGILTASDITVEMNKVFLDTPFPCPP